MRGAAVIRWLFWLIIVLASAWAGVLAAQRQTAGRSLAPEPGEFMASLRQIISPRLAGGAKKPSSIVVPILMYHHIQDLDASQVGTLDWNLSISTDAFEQQLAWLKSAGYQSVSLDQMATGRLPAKPVILTFDDGYADFYSNAWPRLRQAGFTATLYVITGRLNQAGFLTTSQLLTVANAGLEIGSHTASHPNVTKLSGQNRSDELLGSRRYLQKLTGQRVNTFCYPSGEYDDAAVAAVAAAGYQTATTTNEGLARAGASLTMPRLRVRPSQSLTSFRAVVTGQSK